MFLKQKQSNQTSEHLFLISECHNPCNYSYLKLSTTIVILCCSTPKYTFSNCVKVTTFSNTCVKLNFSLLLRKENFIFYALKSLNTIFSIFIFCVNVYSKCQGFIIKIYHFLVENFKRV